MDPEAVPRAQKVDELQAKITSLERRLGQAERRLGEAERKLAETEEDRGSLRALLESIPEGITILDSVGKVKYISAYGAALGSARREDLEGKTFEEAFGSLEAYHSDLNSPMRLKELQVLEVLRSGRTFTNVEAFLRKKGQNTHLLITANAMVNEEGEFNGGLITWRDITARKQMELEGERLLKESERQAKLLRHQRSRLGIALSAAQESRANMAQILESISDGFFSLDREWRFRYINGIAARITGHQPQSCVGKSIWELWPELIGTPVEENYRRAMEGDAPVHFRVEGLKTGYWYDVSVYSSADGITVFFVDRTERIRAEAALGEALDLNQKIVSASQLGILAYRASGQCVLANEAAGRIINASQEQLLAQNFYQIASWKKSGLLEMAIKALSSRKPQQGEVHAITTFGREIWLNWYCNVFYSQGEMHLLATFVDITEWKQAENALRRYELLSANSRDIMLFIDRNELRILEANSAAVKAYGYSREELLGLSVWDLYAFETPERSAKQMAGADAEGLLFETVHLRKDGSPFPVEVSSHVATIGGKPTMISVIRDITERKRYEMELLHSRALMSEAEKLSLTGAWEWDLVRDLWTFSDEWLAIHGSNQRTLAPDGLLQVAHPEDRATIEQALETVRNGVSAYDLEHRIIRLDTGEVRVVKTRGQFVRNAAGAVVKVYGFVQDITERKRAEEVLRESEATLRDYAEKLEHSNRDLQEFAYVASHDLQEPIRKISAFGNVLLKTSGNLDEHQRSYLERICASSDRMQNMIQDLLALSRVTTQGRAFVPVNLAQVAAEVLSDLEYRIQKTGGKVELGDLPEVEADPLQMQQLFQNLIGNALKYHKPDVPPFVRVSSKPVSSTKVQILIEDNGIGFNQSSAERVFHPFQRLVNQSDYEGSGIGLAICKKIVERHSGDIRATGVPGQGATFFVTLSKRIRKI